MYWAGGFWKLLSMINITHQTQCFSCLGKGSSWVSLVGLCGRKNEKHYMMCTYLNSAKLEDSEYTNFYAWKCVLQKASNFPASFSLPKIPSLLVRDNFVILHSIRVFSSDMIYLTHEDNFQNISTELEASGSFCRW